MSTNTTTNARKSRRPKGEGTIFEKDGRFVARVTYTDPRTGRTTRPQVSGATKTEVNRKLKDMIKRLDAGAPPRDHTMLFKDYALQWSETTLLGSGRAASTKTLYAGLTRTHIMPSRLGSNRLDQLSPNSVEAFVAEVRAKGMAQSSVRTIYTVARAIASTAVRDGLLHRNPFALIERPAVEHHEATYLTPEDAWRLLDAASSTRYLPLIEFMLHTGLRRGEALALKWRDVHVGDQAQYVTIRGTLSRQGERLVVTAPKSKKSRRTIFLTDGAAEALANLAGRRATEKQNAGSKWSDTGFVFTTPTGDPCDPRNALRAFKTAAAHAGLPQATLHTLRHTAGSLMLVSGVPMSTVSEVMGHAGIAITVDTYGHVAPHVKRDAAVALGAALARRPGPAA